MGYPFRKVFVAKINNPVSMQDYRKSLTIYREDFGAHKGKAA
jgi:hypothetical protein